jgi:hypothetical protein
MLSISIPDMRRIATIPFPFLKGGFDTPVLRILSQFLNVDSATIRINFLVIQDFLGSSETFVSRIVDFYKYVMFSFLFL